MIIAWCVLFLVPQRASAITLPAPTGPYVPGVTIYRWTDSTRIDPILQPPRAREVAVRIWYPARAGASTPRLQYPSGDSAAPVQTHSVADAPFAGAARPAPVIIFSTGRATTAFAYTTLAEELASRGFVFAVVESPDHSAMTLADGTVVPATAWVPTRAMLEDFSRADEFFEPMNATVSGDMRFVARRFEALNRGDTRLRGAMDLQRLGMAGHSNGAMAGARACATEPLCRAYLGIEGTQPREIRRNGINKPYGLLISDQSLSYDREGVYRELGKHAQNRFLLIRVTGAGHNSVTDLTLTRPALFSYSIEPLRGLAIGRQVTVAFFSKYVGKRETSDSLVTGIPEVTVESYP
jgi:hypothetical protein